MTVRPAAGGGRWVRVAPARLARWFDGFAARHGAIEATGTPEVVRLAAADGAVAECHVPFPPLGQSGGASGASPGDGQRALAASVLPALVAHASRDRLVGVLLVRLGGYATGVFLGDRLLTGKVGSRQVHGRSAAGGWSQRRFARRRDKQVSEALRTAADMAAGVLVPRMPELDAVVLGGDRRAVNELRADRRLEPLFAREAGPFLTVPDPRLAVLRDAPRLFRAVRIRIIDPNP